MAWVGADAFGLALLPGSREPVATHNATDQTWEAFGNVTLSPHVGQANRQVYVEA